MNEKNPAAQALGKLGRSKNTPAQQAAARANGAKGGRPKVLRPGYWCDEHRPNNATPLKKGFKTEAVCHRPSCNHPVAYED